MATKRIANWTNFSRFFGIFKIGPQCGIPSWTILERKQTPKISTECCKGRVVKMAYPGHGFRAKVKYLSISILRLSRYTGGGAYKDGQENIFLQKWTGDNFLLFLGRDRIFYWVFRFLFIFKSILELKVIL